MNNTWYLPLHGSPSNYASLPQTDYRVPAIKRCPFSMAAADKDDVK